MVHKSTSSSATGTGPGDKQPKGLTFFSSKRAKKVVDFRSEIEQKAGLALRNFYRAEAGSRDGRKDGCPREIPMRNVAKWFFDK